MHVTWRDGSETVISHEGGWLQTHGGKMMAKVPMKYRSALRLVVGPFVKKAAKRVAKVAPVVTVGFFAYDWYTGGPEHAVREATWPFGEFVPPSSCKK
jgi:hypothetical protein